MNKENQENKYLNQKNSLFELYNENIKQIPAQSTVEFTKCSANQLKDDFSFSQNNFCLNEDNIILSGASKRRELLNLQDQSLVNRNNLDYQDNIFDIDKASNKIKFEENDQQFSDLQIQMSENEIQEEEQKIDKSKMLQHRQRSQSKSSISYIKDDIKQKSAKKLSIHSLRFKKQSLKQLQDQDICIDNIQKQEAQLDAVEEKEQKNYFQILYYILKFASFVKELNTKKRFQQLQVKHFNIINDISYYKLKTNMVNYSICKFIIKIIKIIIKYLGNKIPVFNSEQLIIILWDCLLFLFLLGQFLYIPFQLVFQNQVQNEQNYIYTQYSLAIQIIDLILTFNITYYSNGNIVTSRKEIAQNYIKGQFIINVLSTFMYFIFFLTKNQWLCLTLLLRIQQFSKLINQIDEYFNLSQRLPTLFELSKLLTTLIIVTQYCACGFTYIAIIEEMFGASITWMTKQGIQDEIWIIKYINALYYSLITMITVGYGDITPVTIPEKLYIMLMTLISCGVFAYVVNTIGQIFREIALKQAAFKKQKYELIQYMNIRKISKQTQIKMIKYLEYQHDQQKRGNQIGESILKDISKTISEEFYIEYFGKILRDHKIFKLNFSDDCLNNVTLIMKEITVGPGELIYKQDEIANKIYFLLDGKVEYFIISKDKNQKQNITLSIEKNPKIIGMKSFFGSIKSQISCRSINISRIAYIEKDDFIKLLIQEYPEDYENYCHLRENIIANNKVYDQKCLSCNLFTHSIMQCPLITMKMNKSLILNKYNNENTINQVRQKYQRKNQIYYSSIVDKPLIAQDLKKIRYDVVKFYLNDQKNNNYQYDDNEDDRQFFQQQPKIVVLNDENIKISEETDEIEKFFLYNDLDDKSIYQKEQREDTNSNKNSQSPLLQQQKKNDILFVDNKNNSPSKIRRRSSRLGSLKQALDAQQIIEKIANRRISLLQGKTSQNQLAQQLQQQDYKKQISLPNDVKSQVTQKSQFKIDEIQQFQLKFDKMKTFQKFFPYNNVENVLQNYQKKQVGYLNKIQRKSPKKKPINFLAKSLGFSQIVSQDIGNEQKVSSANIKEQNKNNQNI